MVNLSASLVNASDAMSVYSSALDVVENDVTNASTPDYAQQTANLEPLPFDPSVGLPGGVITGPTQSSRDPYAEQNVRNAQSQLGFYTQENNDLSPLSSLFDTTDQSGIGAAINGLFNGFSQLSLNPNDPTARQSVLTSAAALTSSFQQTATGLSTSSQQIAQEASGTVSSINALAVTIAQINSQQSQDGQAATDAGLDAQLTSSLEQLSQYANVTALQQPNGTVNVYLGDKPRSSWAINPTPSKALPLPGSCRSSIPTATIFRAKSPKGSWGECWTKRITSCLPTLPA